MIYYDISETLQIDYALYDSLSKLQFHMQFSFTIDDFAYN